MKKLFLFATIAALAIMATGCGKSETDDNPGQTENPNTPDKPDKSGDGSDDKDDDDDSGKLPPLPDENDVCSAMDDITFMNFCYENFDVNKDGKISELEYNAVKEINCDGLQITSFKGIEYFPNLETFSCKENAKIKEIDLSHNKNITVIGYSAFSNCYNLQNIKLPDSVTTIGNSAFENCACLTSITIPDSVTEIGYEAFRGCTGLKGVYITDIAAWCNIEFGNYTSNPLYYTHSLYLNGELVKDLVIPDSVTTIGSYAFRYCTSLTSITIPNNVAGIGDSAFSHCTGLTSITIPDSVNVIGRDAFLLCTGLTSITISNGVTSISDKAFYGCTGELFINCNIPSYSTAFYEAKFTKVTIGNSVTTIGNSAFENCTSLTSITIPDSVTEIGYEAFKGCTSLKGVYISDIAAWCNIKFGYNSNPLYYAHNLYLNGELVTDLVIPDGVTSIGSAFVGCTSLTSVTIPASVTEIGSFYGCAGLKTIYCKASIPPTIYTLTFSDVKKIAKIYVPRESVYAYKAAEGWKNLAAIIEGYDFE